MSFRVSLFVVPLSRQINKKDRLIYKVKEETITIYIVSAIGHYGDK